MRRAVVILTVLAVLATGAFVALQRFNAQKERSALDDPWPLGAGPAGAVASRYPNQETTPAAQRLTQLAKYFRIPLGPKRDGDPLIARPLQRDLEPYIDAQIARPSFAVDPAPPLLISIFGTAQFAGLRAELLRGEPIGWPVRFERSGSLPNLTGHLMLHRLLIASALERARRGDAGAWDDLRASRELNRSLWSRPEVLSHVVALQMTRTAVAAARKLPPPAPPWFEEMLGEEMEPRFVRSLQAEVALSGSAPALHLARRTTEQAVASRACAVDGPAFDKRVGEDAPPEGLPTMGSTWQRIARYRAEREATRIALALRSGAQPPLRSSCSDRAWKREGSVVRLDPPLPAVRKDVEIPLEVPLSGL